MFTKKKETDPVCGMNIIVKASTARSEFKEKVYYFCSNDCLTEFEADPQKYASSPNSHCCGGEHSEKCQHNHAGHEHAEKHHGHCNNKEDHGHKCQGHHSHSHHG